MKLQGQLPHKSYLIPPWLLTQGYMQLIWFIFVLEKNPLYSIFFSLINWTLKTKNGFQNHLEIHVTEILFFLVPEKIKAFLLLRAFWNKLKVIIITKLIT